MTTATMTTLATVPVPKIWVGETVAILATGPSLTPEQVACVRDRVRVIAINDAHRLAPWADVLYSSDRRWWPHYKGVPSFGGMKYGVGASPGGPVRTFRECPEVAILRNTGANGLERDPSGLRTACTSGYAAINLAVHFGVQKILLLGYNLNTYGQRTHFFGSHPPSLNQAPALYPNFRRSMAQLVDPLAALGIDVINCTPHSSLDCFPCRPLAEVLR